MKPSDPRLTATTCDGTINNRSADIQRPTSPGSRSFTGRCEHLQEQILCRRAYRFDPALPARPIPRIEARASSETPSWPTLAAEFALVDRSRAVATCPDDPEVATNPAGA